MSRLTLQQSATAVAPSIQASFQGAGGTGPYSYAVVAGGAGGNIDPLTGIYKAPYLTAPNQPLKLFDTIVCTDTTSPQPQQTRQTILIGNALLLFCEIIQRCMGLSADRVYLWDQKLNQPTDDSLYIAVSVPMCKPFANVNEQMPDGRSLQWLSMSATADVDIISRDSSARDRKEEMIMALESNYSRYQQDANSFYIGKLPIGSRFMNLTEVDGAAIPYRYKISIAVQYVVSKIVPVPYFNDFSQPTVTVNT